MNGREAIRKALRRLGYDVRCFRDTSRRVFFGEGRVELGFEFAMSRLLLVGDKPPFFVQVGACDGQTCDPLREFIVRFQLPGVMCEPRGYICERLRRLYAGQPAVQVVHAAIDGTVGSRLLYAVKADGLPGWVETLASFDLEVVRKHRDMIPDLDARIFSTDVPVTTFDAMFAECGVTQVDVLLIDTEGYDAAILEMFPFDRHRPALVCFEVAHLSATAVDNALERLIAFGYGFAQSGTHDMVALRPECFVFGEDEDGGGRGV